MALTLPLVTTLDLRLDGDVLHLTFDRPQARNAMSPAMLADIEAVAGALHADTGYTVRALVLRGRGGHFCAGADLKDVLGKLAPPAPGATDPVAEVNRAFGTMLRRVESIPAVVIAVCEGAVLGGGFGLACVSDITLAHTETRFGLPETARGLPPAQIAPFVVKRLGLAQARRLALTAAQFRGTEAEQLGLAHGVFSSEDELAGMLHGTLKRVLACAPIANARTKALLLAAAASDDVDGAHAEALLDTAAAAFAACARGAEAPEGIAAFVQKRPPAWARP